MDHSLPTNCTTSLHEKLRPLVNLLADGNFHSEAELTEVLAITRSHLQDLLHAAAALDLSYVHSTEHGYKLSRTIELLDSAIIQDALFAITKKFITQLQIFTSIDSTNDYLLKQIKINPTAGQVCIAEMQTAGRGRRGRQWFSPFAQNLYFSLTWNFSGDLKKLGGLSLVIAIAIAHTLQQAGVPHIQLKWPNDVLGAGKKLAGILIETTLTQTNHCTAVIGVGINLNATAPKSSVIEQPWTSVQELTGRKSARNLFTANLLNNLIPQLIKFSEQGLNPFLNAWQQFDFAKDKYVTLLTAQGSLTGKYLGINSSGALLLEDEFQQQHSFLSAEISLRLAPETATKQAK